MLCNTQLTQIMDQSIAEESVQGSMIGQCVGDALGFIVEGHGPSRCAEYVKEFISGANGAIIPTWTRSSCSAFKFGQYSDDSQLARETFIAVLQGGGRIDPAIYALRIALLFQPNAYRIVGYGRATACGAHKIWMGEHYTRSGSATASGDGSAMRSGPIGLIMAKFPLDDICKVATTFSSITHASRACTDGSIAIAVGTNISMVTRGRVFDVEEYLRRIAEKVVDREYGKEIINIIQLIKSNDSEAAKHIIAYGTRCGEVVWDGISVGVRQSTLWALYSFCKFPNDFVKCIATAIASGGDVDTTAAMAGALSGARVGFFNIPKIWREAVHDIDIWNMKDLCELVHKVFVMVDNSKINITTP